MRASHLVLVALTWLGGTAPSFAQPAPAPPLVRFDVQGSLGWTHVASPDFLPYENWDHGIAQGAAGLGWYWTDHLKTEVEFQANSRAEFFGYEETLAGRSAYRYSQYDLRSTGVSVGQVYQFRRNAWVHPFVAGGVDLRWETIDQEIQPVVIWDSGANGPREVEPGRTVPSRTTFKAQPFALIGMKAYFSKRAFFRSDFRVGVNDGAEEIVVRMGVGVDF
jgi:hypothetical protein